MRAYVLTGNVEPTAMRNLLLLGAFLLYSNLASGSSLSSFEFSCVTNNNTGDCAIGESQLRMSLNDIGGGEVAFRFENTGPDASAIAQIYFDDAAPGSDLTFARLDQSTGVSFTWGDASPGDLPGGQTVGFHATDGFLTDADNPKPQNGVNPSEWLDIIFLLGSVNIDDLLGRLDTGSLRVGVHVQSFTSGGSESFVNTPTPVPLPAAGWMMLTALLSSRGLVAKQLWSNYWSNRRRRNAVANDHRKKTKQRSALNPPKRLRISASRFVFCASDGPVEARVWPFWSVKLLTCHG